MRNRKRGMRGPLPQRPPPGCHAPLRTLPPGFHQAGGDPGASVEFVKVLAVGSGEGVNVGKPYVENAKVVASIIAQERAKKVIIFKKKRRKNYRRTKGHRQYYTKLKIQEVIG